MSIKNIKELELLVNFAKSLGQTPDPKMVEQVREHYEFQKKIVDSVKANAAKDLNEAFGQKIIEETKDELVQTNTIEEIISEETLPDSPTEHSLADRAAQLIKDIPKKDSFQQPNIPFVDGSMKAIQDKLKFLEQWLGKVSMAGPGGGAVKLRDLDDVSKSSIRNATEHQYLTYNAQSKLWVASNHSNYDIKLDDLVDVVITAPRDGQVLKFDGVANAWVAAADIAVTQNGAPVISFSDLTVATLPPTNGGTLQYNANTGVFSHAPSVLDTLDSVTTRGNVTTNSIAVSSVSIPVGSLLSGSGNIIASILNERLDSVLEYGNNANLSIGDYGLTNGITNIPYVVYRLKTNPVIPLQVGDVMGGASVPSTSTILAVGTGANANIVITNTNFAANALIPLANTVLTFARAITNAGLSISTNANTDITLNPGAGGYIVPHSDIIPFTTNQWSIGTPAKRFKEIWLGTGTIYVQDETLGNDQALGARGGNFYIDGGAGLEVGEFTFIDNQIKIKNNTRDMIVGTVGATANVVFNRAIKVNTANGFNSFSITRDGRVQINVPNIAAGDPGGLNIVGSSSGVYQPITNPGGMLHITGNDGNATRVNLDNFNNGSNTTSFNAIIGRGASGTAQTPTKTRNGDILLRIGTVGWKQETGFGGASFTSQSLDLVALEDFYNASRGTAYTFYNAPLGSNTRSFSAKIDSTGLNFVQPVGAIYDANIGIRFNDNTRQTTAFTASAVNAYVRPMLTTANVIESSSNLYFTNTRVVSALSTDSTLTLNANGKITSNLAYGQFWDTTTQLCNANTATLMRFNKADGRIGVSLANANTRVILQNVGTYNLQFSSQFVNTDNSPQNTWIWFRQANVDLEDSAGLLAVPKKDGATNGSIIVSWNTFVTTTTPNDYVELVWFTVDQAKNQMTAYANISAVPGVTPAIPAIPSVILTVEQIR